MTISKSERMYWNSGVQHFGTVEHNYDSREELTGCCFQYINRKLHLLPRFFQEVLHNFGTHKAVLSIQAQDCLL